jgi:hypothetical protein
MNAGSSSPELVAIEARKADRPAETLLDSNRRHVTPPAKGVDQLVRWCGAAGYRMA